MKNYIFIITCLLCIIIFSCSTHQRINPSKVQFVKQLSKMYDKNIIDFFPSEATFGNNWRSYHSSSWDDSTESIFNCCAYFSAAVASNMIDSLEKQSYIAKMNYDDSLFMINVPYIRREESYTNLMMDTSQIPIADMRYSYFALGKTTDTIIIGQRYCVMEHEILPSDLVIYVMEAGKGNFWKNRDKAAQEDRPVLLEPWKHGYVKGLAISRDLSRVCWWAMAW